MCAGSDWCRQIEGILRHRDRDVGLRRRLRYVLDRGDGQGSHHPLGEVRHVVGAWNGADHDIVAWGEQERGLTRAARYRGVGTAERNGPCWWRARLVERGEQIVDRLAIGQPDELDLMHLAATVDHGHRRHAGRNLCRCIECVVCSGHGDGGADFGGGGGVSGRVVGGFRTARRQCEGGEASRECVDRGAGSLACRGVGRHRGKSLELSRRGVKPAAAVGPE